MQLFFLFSCSKGTYSSIIRVSFNSQRYHMRYSLPLRRQADKGELHTPPPPQLLISACVIRKRLTEPTYVSAPHTTFSLSTKKGTHLLRRMVGVSRQTWWQGWLRRFYGISQDITPSAPVLRAPAAPGAREASRWLFQLVFACRCPTNPKKESGREARNISLG